MSSSAPASSAAATAAAGGAAGADDVVANAPRIDLSPLKRAKLLFPGSSAPSSSSTSTASQQLPDDLFTSSSVIALYFSASWCPPCRAFTPRLAAAYEKMKAKAAANAKKSDGGGSGGDGGDNDSDKAPSSSSSSTSFTKTEIVLVGFDRTRESLERYAATMPFPAIAWDDESGARERLAAAANLGGIPSLVLVRGSDGAVLQTDGRTRVLRDPDMSRWPWIGIKPAVGTLPLWAQWIALGVFYVGMKFLIKVVRRLLGWE